MSREDHPDPDGDPDGDQDDDIDELDKLLGGADEPGSASGQPRQQQQLQQLGGGLHANAEGYDPLAELEDDVDVSDAGAPTAAERKMAMHLHAVTGHRPPLRLARALVISGADAKLVRAAKELKCEVCHELQPVKTRRPADLPRVRNFGDRVYTDLFSLHDVQGNTFLVAHAVDAATRYQVAKVLENKSSQQVVQFFRECWFNVLGTPAAVTADILQRC